MKKILSNLLMFFLLVSSGCTSNVETIGTVEPTVKPTTETVVKNIEEVDLAPYYRIAGFALENLDDINDLPIAVWVDFQPSDDTVLKVRVVGEGNPYLAENVQNLLCEYAKETDTFIGKKASELTKQSTTLEEAVTSAAKSYLATKDKFIIRPYQSMMTERYLQNNPYIVDNAALTGSIQVDTEIVANYQQDESYLVTEDVKSGDNIKFPGGKGVSKFTGLSDNEYEIVSGVYLAKTPGIAVISYTYANMTLYDAVDIYENFTLELSGSDAYGSVVNTKETDNEITYRVLGDKAMNFPGGTCGSTVIDVVINKTDNTISSVQVIEHSDSTYLANPWEYNGGFVNTGIFIYRINQYCDKFIGLPADTEIMPYVVATKDNPDGGLIVDGGIDMIVSGATRTSNAIIYAVNAAIAEYNKN